MTEYIDAETASPRCRCDRCGMVAPGQFLKPHPAFSRSAAPVPSAPDHWIAVVMTEVDPPNYDGPQTWRNLCPDCGGALRMFMTGAARNASEIIKNEIKLGEIYAEIAQIKAELERFKKLDREAATHVESVICMRSKHFTGKHPYVGWKGLGMALSLDYDDIENLRGALTATHDDVRAAETRGWNAAIEMAGATLDVRQRYPASAIRALRKPAP